MPETCPLPRPKVFLLANCLSEAAGRERAVIRARNQIPLGRCSPAADHPPRGQPPCPPPLLRISAAAPPPPLLEAPQAGPTGPAGRVAGLDLWGTELGKCESRSFGREGKGSAEGLETLRPAQGRGGGP